MKEKEATGACLSCYEVAKEELVTRMKMRDQMSLLNATASLAVFGFVFKQESPDPNIIMIIPHIGFAAVLLFAQQHSLVGALFYYFHHLGEQSSNLRVPNCNSVFWRGSYVKTAIVSYRGILILAVRCNCRVRILSRRPVSSLLLGLGRLFSAGIS